MTKYNDAHIADLAESAEKVIADGGTIFFKWTCEGCGERVTATEPNTFTHYSKHDDCGHVTNTLKSGGNYIAITGIPLSEVMEMMGKIAGSDRNKN